MNSDLYLEKGAAIVNKPESILNTSTGDEIFGVGALNYSRRQTQIGDRG